METDDTTQNFFFAKRRLMRAFQEWCNATHNAETPINLFLFMAQKGVVDVDSVAEKLEPIEVEARNEKPSTDMDDDVKAGVNNLIRATDYITKNFVDLIRKDSEDYRQWAASRGLCEDKSREAYQKHVEHEQYIRDLLEREEELKSELNHLGWEINNS